jgi:hypothetical protein
LPPQLPLLVYVHTESERGERKDEREEDKRETEGGDWKERGRAIE